MGKRIPEWPAWPIENWAIGSVIVRLFFKRLMTTGSQASPVPLIFSFEVLRKDVKWKSFVTKCGVIHPIFFWLDENVESAPVPLTNTSEPSKEISNLMIVYQQSTPLWLRRKYQANKTALKCGRPFPVGNTRIKLLNLIGLLLPDGNARMTFPTLVTQESKRKLKSFVAQDLKVKLNWRRQVRCQWTISHNQDSLKQRFPYFCTQGPHCSAILHQPEVDVHTQRHIASEGHFTVIIGCVLVLV